MIAGMDPLVSGIIDKLVLDDNPLTQQARELGKELCSSGNPDVRPIAPRQGPQPAKSCDYCHTALEKALCCAQCKLVSYCGRDCQKSHWKSGHKAACVPSTANLRVGDKDITLDRGMYEPNEAPALRRGYETQPSSSEGAPFEWDINTWQHSKPAIFNKGLGCGCMQGESSVCSIKPFDDVHNQCSVRVLHASDVLGIGVCIKKSGKMTVFWKYSGNALKFCSNGGVGGPFGKPYSTGDVVTVRIKDDALEFDLNGEPLGPAFTDLKPNMGPFYLRVSLVNNYNVRALPYNAMRVRDALQKVRAGRLTEGQYMNVANNVGLPSRSDPSSMRSEVLIVP
eukprot:jgi/Mesvir1/24463/Mv21827-RA.1